MLILTRKINETIKIGDDITIHLLGTTNFNARIGIDAPKEVPVHREEIYNKIQAQKGFDNDRGNC